MPTQYDDDDDDTSAENNEENADEVEEIEFSMTEGEIDEWIAELKVLKEEKEALILPIDDKMQLKINFKEILDL